MKSMTPRKKSLTRRYALPPRGNTTKDERESERDKEAKQLFDKLGFENFANAKPSAERKKEADRLFAKLEEMLTPFKNAKNQKV